MNDKQNKSHFVNKTNADADIALVFRKKTIPPPSVLLLTLPKDVLPNENIDENRLSPAAQLRSQQRQTHQTTRCISLHLRDPLTKSSPTVAQWQRYSDKMSQIPPAPDVAYKNTYLDDKNREPSEVHSTHRAAISRGKSKTDYLSPRSSRQNSNSNRSSNVYENLRQSLRQIEQQRNTKQQNISVRIKRPQNEDQTFRRVLAEKKHSARSSLSRSSLTTSSTSKSKFLSINDDLNSTQSFVNYINYSRCFQPILPH